MPRAPGDADSEERKPDTPPGIGHNRPPEGKAPERPGVQDNELRPGVSVRGDPKSRLWQRFTGALKRIPGDKSRQAAEELVNGGELTTAKGAGGDTTDITRKGGLKESREAYDDAVRTSGGNPNTIKPRVRNGVEIRPYTAPDGTRFTHRTISTAGQPTVEVQIEKNVPPGQDRPPIEHKIKIRFE